MLWLTFEIVNTCLTQLKSQPPFESSLHSQLWGAAHRGSQKHLQSWNSVWDLCSNYTGTPRVHILSHDFLRQPASALFECNTVTLGFKVWVSWKKNKKSKTKCTLKYIPFAGDANKSVLRGYVSVSVVWHVSLLASVIDLLWMISSRLEVHIKHH